MKKVFMLFTVMTAAFALIGCSLADKITSEQGNLFDSKDNVIGFSALSSIMTLHDGVEDLSLYQAQGMNLSTNNQEDTFAILSEVEELKPYLDLVSTFMANGSGFDVSVGESDHEDYEHKMTITTINMEGERISYDMHYNETFDVDDDEEFDTEEFDSVLEGIMIIDGVTYTLYAEREVDEGEESLELVAKLDDDNYITLDYEIENDDNEYESEFVYEMFVNNQLVKRIEIEFEQDDEETELSLKFIRGNRESEYEFEVEIDGNKRYIEIEYKIVEDGVTIEEGEIEVSIIYDPDTGQTFIRYEIEKNGEKIVVDDDYETPNHEENDDEDLDNNEEDDDEDQSDETA